MTSSARAAISEMDVAGSRVLGSTSSRSRQIVPTRATVSASGGGTTR